MIAKWVCLYAQYELDLGKRLQGKPGIQNGKFRDNLHVKVAKMTNTFTAVVHKEDNLYVAVCPEAGTVSQGESIEEAVKNLQEATELYLEEFPLKRSSRPFLTTFEVPANA